MTPNQPNSPARTSIDYRLTDQPDSVEGTQHQVTPPSDAGTFVQSGSQSWAGTQPTGFPDLPGYEIERELGRGGMGVVYLARQVMTNRPVAIKMILGNPGPEDRERFRLEAEAIAGIDHPHIIRIYDVGEVNGCPFFVLEFAPGGSLHHKLDGAPWPSREAAEMIRKLAEGTAAAHAAGIIHRDLKPHNVLLTAKGEPKIGDFGLAKQMDSDSGNTKTGAIIGTPLYMSPEQAAGDVRALDMTTDVYALGAILYELLTGRPPFRGATVYDTLDQIRHHEAISVRSVNPQAARDLETICSKCLRKEPLKRYASAVELAADLGRWLEGKSITARPVGLLERASKWVRRNPGLAVSLASLFTICFGATIYFALLTADLRRSLRERDDNEYLNNLSRAEHELLDNRDIEYAQKLLDAVAPNLKNGWEHRHLENRLYRGPRLLQPVRDLKKETRIGVWHVAATPDGSMVASVGIDGTIRCFDTRTDRVQHELGFDNLIALPAFVVKISANGKHLAASGLMLKDGEVQNVIGIWDLSQLTRRPKQILTGHTAFIKGLSFSPDSNLLVSGAGDGTVRVWQVITGVELVQFTGHQGSANAVGIDRTGRYVASGGGDKTIRIWDLESRKLIRVIESAHDATLAWITFSPTDDRFASAGFDDTVRVWDLSSGNELQRLRGHFGATLGVAYSPDGSRLASCGFDRTVRIWDPQSGKNLLTLRGHKEMVWAVDFTRDGNKLLSASFDDSVMVWDAEKVPHDADGEERDLTNDIVFDHDGKRYAVTGRDGAIYLHDARTDRKIRSFAAHKGSAWGAKFSRDGRRLATSGWDGFARVWDLENNVMEAEFVATAGTHSVDFHPTENRLLFSAIDGKIQEYDLTTRTHLRDYDRPTSHIAYSAVYSPDGTLVAGGGFSSGIWIWDANTGKLITSLGSDLGLSSINPFATKPKEESIHRGSSCQITFGVVAGKTYIASAAWDHKVRVWEVPLPGKSWSLDPLWVATHDDYATTVAFHPDRAVVASAAFDKTVRLWDLKTGKPLGKPVTMHGWIWCVTFQPGSDDLLATNWYRPEGVRRFKNFALSGRLPTQK